MNQTLHTFQLNVVSAEGEVFSGEVVTISVTGNMGVLGIMRGHAPLLTTLRPGPVCITRANNAQEIFYVSGGVLEVQPYLVTILSDTAARASELDETAALSAKENAEKMFSGQHTALDMKHATTQLAEAIAQIRTIQYLRRLKK